MRIVVEASQDHGIEIPRTFRLKVSRIEVVEVLDQWYGPDYRYCKVTGGEGALYILRLDERRSEWHLTMFARDNFCLFINPEAQILFDG